MLRGGGDRVDGLVCVLECEELYLHSIYTNDFVKQGLDLESVYTFTRTCIYIYIRMYEHISGLQTRTIKDMSTDSPMKYH
jgi:hypothetical protein